MIAWSATTLASAWATSFEMLVVLRVGLAIGEAALTPAAISLISDLFPRSGRSIAAGVYGAAGALGLSIAFMTSGVISHLHSSGVFRGLLILGDMSAWRMMLVVTSLAGFAITTLMFIGSARAEPARQSNITGSSDGELNEDPTLGVFTERAAATRFYVFYLLGCAVFTISAFSLLIWYPTHLVRAYGLTTSQASFISGMIYLVAGTGGYFGFPLLIGLLMRAERNWLVPVAMVSGGAGCALLALAVEQTTLLPSLIFAVGAVFFVSSAGPLSYVGVAVIAGSSVRGRLTAVGQSLNIAVGLGLGPLIVGTLSKNVFSGPLAIAHALAATAGIAGRIALLSLSFALPPYLGVVRRARKLRGAGPQAVATTSA